MLRLTELIKLIEKSRKLPMDLMENVTLDSIYEFNGTSN